MKSSYAVVLVTVLALVGCDTIKGFMPGPTANKAITVPADAKTLALDSADGIVLPANSPGDYYIVENDTRNVALFFSVGLGENSKEAFTPKRQSQLDTKRKYQVYYVPHPATTQPGYRPASFDAVTPVAPVAVPAPAPRANPLVPTTSTTAPAAM